MRETWFVLDDGTAVHPSEVAPNDDGVLAHSDGRLVAMRDDGETPRSRGVDVEMPPSDEELKSAADKKAADEKAKSDANAAKENAAADAAAAASGPDKKTSEMKPEPKPKAPRKPGYKTRKAT